MSAPTDRCDIAIIGGGIVGLATAMALVERTPRLGRGARGRGPPRRAPDRPQQRRHPLGPLLQARLAQGAELRRGPRGALPLLRRARHRPRALRQGRARRARARAAAARGAGAPRPGERAAGPAAPRPGGDPRARAPRPRHRRALRARHRHRGLHRGHRGLRGQRARRGRRVSSPGRASPPAGATRRPAGLRRTSCWRPRGAPCAAARWSTAPGSIPTAWRACAAWSPACASSPSAASTTSSCRSSTHLVRNLIYPVPDPRFPFLGVHFTRMVHGGVEAGPNAVLALKREGYGRADFSLRDTAELLAYRRLLAHGAAGTGAWAWANCGAPSARAPSCAALRRLSPRSARGRRAPRRRGGARPGARARRQARATTS